MEPVKIDWNEVVKKMADDKKRIHAYKGTDQEHLISDIKFVKPAALLKREDEYKLEAVTKEELEATRRKSYKYIM